MGRTRLTPLALAGLLAVAATGFVLLRGGDRPAAPAAVPPVDPDVEGYDADVPPAGGPRRSFAGDGKPFLDVHCVGCHSGDRAKGGVAFDADPPAGDPALRRKSADAVRSGRMPPPGRPRPAPAEADRFLGWTDAADRPGLVTLRRLNRAEYNNTVRDLVGVAGRPADDFPIDDTGDGFDTLGAVLSVSPTLAEKYLSAAEAVVAAAAADPAAWARITHPPADDLPFVLRGPPPQRADAIKGAQDGSADGSADEAAAARAAEVERAYAAVRAFADRAYRRPVTHAELARLVRFVDAAVEHGEGTDAGVKLALKAVLVSPHFLFKVELDPDGGPGPDRPVTGFELAARLSYFLWASQPDDELYRLAAAGTLHEPRALVGQVRRMLADPKARALAEHFAGQWLQTRALAEAAPDPARFPGFDADLRAAMRTETELFVDHVVRQDRSALDLLAGEYTFVNDRLARHYGLAGVTGGHFRQVSLAGTGRAGVLTHASVLTVTSGPTRTSPVKRGKWVLDNLLGTPPPPPPPGADDLRDADGPAATVRERLDRHRVKAECASCHARMDPLGFGLENFDAVGAWRDRDGAAPVDASGSLPDGRSFRGPAELRAVLTERPDDFVRCLTEKLMTYGLGRSLGPADRPAVDRAVRHAARNGYRFSSLVTAIVRGDPFQKRPAAPGGDQ